MHHSYSYSIFQNNIYDCKRKRKFWVTQKQVTDSTGIEQWLLSRQKISTGEKAKLYFKSSLGPTKKLQTKMKQDIERNIICFNEEYGNHETVSIRVGLFECRKACILKEQ